MANAPRGTSTENAGSSARRVAPGQRAILVVNPSSAGGQTRLRWPQLEEEIGRALAASGGVEVRFTERPGHATEIARAALADGAGLVIAMGGDGTINEVVNGFFGDDGRAVSPLGADAAFAVLPAGTGGDFIKTTGIPRVLADAARGLGEALTAGRRRRIDAARLTFLDENGATATRHFINVASFGIGGLVDRYVNRSPQALKGAIGGKASFLLATVRASLAYKNARCRVRLDDGRAEERRVYCVAVANGRFFGGGMKIAPDAALDDGRFDVVTIGDVSMAQMMRHSGKIYRGTHVELPFVTVERARRVTAESIDSEEVLLDVDGEQPGRLPASFEILPGALSLVS